MDWFVAIATIGLAFATAVMAWKTRDLAVAASEQTAASRDQADVARTQVGLLERQLAEERAEHERRSQEAAEAYRIATETLRESVRSRLDAGMAHVSIYATPSDLEVQEPTDDGARRVVQLVDRLPVMAEHIVGWWFRLHIDFTVMNRGGVAVHIDAPNPSPGAFDGEQSDRFHFILNPGEDRSLTWRVEMEGRRWWRWCQEGRSTAPMAGNRWLTEFHFQVHQPLARGVVQNHILRAEISPCVIREGAIRQVHPRAVNMRQLAAVDLDYVGLRDLDNNSESRPGA